MNQATFIKDYIVFDSPGLSFAKTLSGLYFRELSESDLDFYHKPVKTALRKLTLLRVFIVVAPMLRSGTA